MLARGFLLKHIIYYTEVFALVARLEIVRLVVAIARRNDWSLYHLDVKSTFLNDPLEETMYVTQRLGFVIKGNECMVYKLDKTFMVWSKL